MDDAPLLKREREGGRWEMGWKWYLLITDMMLGDTLVY